MGRKRNLLRVPRIPASNAARATIWVVGMSAGILQGLLILLGGPERWTSPTLLVLAEFPGGPDAWGAFAWGFGLAIVGGSWARLFYLKALGLVGLSIWCFAFATGAFKAALYDGGGTTAGPAYLCLCVVCAILITLDETKRPVT